MLQATVVIVAAGASGLSAAAALQRLGIETVILDQDQRVGDIWARRYDRLQLHTVRACSGLAHYPIPSRYFRYLTCDEFVAYLGEYAHHFGLRIEAGCRVQRSKSNRRRRLFGRPRPPSATGAAA